MGAKQAASLAGLAPVTRRSDKWRGKTFIQVCMAILRQAIYMPALVAIRFNPPLKIRYDAAQLSILAGSGPHLQREAVRRYVSHPCYRYAVTDPGRDRRRGRMQR